MNITVFKSNIPKVPGTYIFVGNLTRSPELVTVVSRPYTDPYESQTHYLADASSGRNVDAYKGWWSEPLRFVLP